MADGLTQRVHDSVIPESGTSGGMAGRQGMAGAAKRANLWPCCMAAQGQCQAPCSLPLEVTQHGVAALVSHVVTGQRDSRPLGAGALLGGRRAKGALATFSPPHDRRDAVSARL